MTATCVINDIRVMGAIRYRLSDKPIVINYHLDVSKHIPK